MLRLSLSVLGLVAVVFAPSLAGDFVWDDVLLIRDNPNAHSLAAGWRVAFGDFFGSAAGQPQGGYLRPVPALLNAATWAVAGARPWVFHLQNLALHLAAVALLMAVLRALGARALGWVGAGLLFGLHLRQVEAVAFISGRPDLLAAAGVLAATWLHLRARRDGGGAVGPLAVVAFGLAALSKEVALVWPVALAVLEGSGAVAPTPRRRRALFAGYGAVIAAVVIGRLVGDIQVPVRLYFEASQAPIAALSLVGHYAVWLLTPDARALYDHLPVATASGWTALGAAIVVAVAGLVWVNRRKPAGFGWALAAVALAPVLHLVPIPALAADRYLYLPLAGLAVALGVGLSRWDHHRAAWGLICAAALVLGVFSTQRVRDWQDEVTLWSAEALAPEASYKAWLNLSVAHAEHQRWPEAFGAVTQAATLAPGVPVVWRNQVRIGMRLCPQWPGQTDFLILALKRTLTAAQLRAAAAGVPCPPVAEAARRHADALSRAER